MDKKFNDIKILRDSKLKKLSNDNRFVNKEKEQYYNYLEETWDRLNLIMENKNGK